MDNTQQNSAPDEQVDDLNLDAILDEFRDVPDEVVDDDLRIDLDAFESQLEAEAPAPPAIEPAPEAQEEESPASPELAHGAPIEPVTSDTIRLDDLSEVATASEPSVATPIEEETPATEDAPLEEVFIPAPIPFRPKQRLRELKKKLIAGPEKRYYDLSELGTGKLQMAIFFDLVIVALCAFAAFSYANGTFPANRMRLLVFSQILAMLVSALLGCYCLMDGISDLFHGKFSLNTMLFFTLIACGIDAVFCLRELRVPCCAAFSLSLTMSLWDRCQRRTTEMGQMDTMRKATRLDSVVKSPDYHDGRAGILRGEGQVEDFMDTYATRSGPERVQSIFALISFLLCIGIAVLAGMRHGVSMAFQILAPAMLMATPASFFIAISRPMAILERRLHMVGTVICGWQGVKALSTKVAFPLSDSDIFPTGSVKLNGVKYYGDRTPEDAIAYASALMAENGGALAPVFRELLKSKDGFAYQVENFRVYPTGGIGGEVCKEPVLLGTIDFLQDMGVEIPEGTLVNQAVYCSIDGQLSAVFAITYGKLKSSAAGLVSLCANRKLTCVMLCDDFMLNESFLRSKFSVSTRRMRFLEREERQALAQRKATAEDTALALTTQDGLSPIAYAISGARSVRTATRMGLWLHIFAGILGMLIMASLAYIGNTELLTPLNILLYQLVWTIPALLISSWTRAV